jgi:hypothetical protein
MIYLETRAFARTGCAAVLHDARHARRLLKYEKTSIDVEATGVLKDFRKENVDFADSVGFFTDLPAATPVPFRPPC